MMKNKKAFLAYSFSANNAGDFALTVAAIDILIKNNFDIVVVSRFKENTKEYRDTNEYYKRRYKSRVRMIESPFKLEREASLAKRILNNIHGGLILFNILKDSRIEKEIRNVDIVVMGGGNLLRCSSFADYMRLQALYYPLGIAKKLNKDYVVFPQSTAEVNDMGKSILGKLINNAKTVFIREHLSYVKLKKLFPKANLLETLDLAFLLLDSSKFKVVSGAKKKVAFTCRIDGIGGLRKFTEQEKEEIQVRIENVVEKLRSECDFTFIVQAPHRDREFTEYLRDNIKQKYALDIPIVEEHDPIVLIDIYSSFDLLIGMRLHSIILAACAGTPSYGLFFKEWGLKNPGIMDSLSLPYSMIEDEKLMNVEAIKMLLETKSDFQKRVLKLYETDAVKFERVLGNTL